MPELAAAYAVGVIACATLTFIFFLVWHKRHKQSPFATLATNLKKADLYWSDNQDRILPLTSDTEEKDLEQGQRTILLTGALLSALSWGGLVFLSIIMVSYFYLARSRTERRLMETSLATDPTLTADEVMRLAREFQVGDPNSQPSQTQPL